MSQSKALLSIAVGAVVLLVAVVAWTFLQGGGAPREAASGPKAAVAAARDEPTATLAPGKSLTTPAPIPSGAAPEADRAEVPIVPVERREPEWKKDGSQWLAGRVTVSSKTPQDEQILVIAVDEERSAEELYDPPGPASRLVQPGFKLGGGLISFAEVDPDGTFRIELPASAELAHVALAGRYSFSRGTTPVALPAAELTLNAELGAWISGVLVAPRDATTEQRDLSGIQVELGPDITGGFDALAIQNEAWEHEFETGEDGRFEFRAVNTVITHGVAVQADRLAGKVELGIAAEPGDHVQLEVVMEQGATIRGRVLDPDGTAVAEAEVSARMRGILGRAIGGLREAKTDERGAFELRNVALGEIEVVAEHEGFKPGKLKLLEELGEGDVVEGVELALSLGATIAGRVLMPDGSPASNASVLATPDLSGAMGMGAMGIAGAETGKAKTDENGDFLIAGLSDIQYQLTATQRTEQAQGDEEPEAPGLRLLREGDWKKVVKGVAAPSSGVEIVLEGLVDVTGVVIDLAGEPVTGFNVDATLKGSGAMFGIGAERKSGSFKEETGRFTLHGLGLGTWEMFVTSKGYATSALQEVELPRAPEEAELTFLMEPNAAVSGLVVDTVGQPAVGARVGLSVDLATRIKASTGGGGALPETFSNAEGRFRLELDPGTVSLVASLEGHAQSKPVSCELESGAVVEDVVLELRRGGTLTGIVMNDDGEPDTGRMVIVQKTPDYSAQHILTTDALGEFRVEHMDPGTWQVIASANFMDAAVEEDGEEVMQDFLGNMKMDMAEIVDGEETHVVLGAPPDAPVKVRGRVLHGGEPVEGILISAMPEEAGGLSALKMGTTRGDGSFELDLDHPGAYLFGVQTNNGMGQQNNTELIEHIPEGVDEHEVLFELPLGRISGRVIGPKGNPLAGCRVSLTADGGAEYGSVMGGKYVEDVTDAGGRYDIQYIHPGTYSIAAGGVAFGGLFGEESPGGRVVQSGIHIEEGEWLDSIDFKLKDPGTLSGTVVDEAGRPVAEAILFVRDENGRLLEQFSMVASNASGSFTYAGVAPGTYFLSARTETGVSAESSRVRVSEGETASVKVVMGAGAMLLVSVIDKSGEELRVRLSVTDSRGNEYSSMRSLAEIMDRIGGGFSTKEHRVGPVPPGSYRLIATADDGRTAKKSVTITDQSERKVKIRLR